MNKNRLFQDNTAFALDLYQGLKGQAGNLFFSPYSISTALAMTYAGARAKTADEMAGALHFALKPALLHPAFANLQAELQKVGGGGGPQLKVANALWPQVGYPFLAKYLDLIREYYGEQISPLDYADPEGARQTINAWVARKTEAKIQDLIPPGLLNPLVRLVLTNAIYFKGDWAEPFDPLQTEAGLFHTREGQSVEAPFMQHQEQFGYAEQDGLQMLELPYAESTLSLVIFLPSAGELENLEAQFTPKNLETWLRRLFPREVRLSLPRFKVSASFLLNEALMRLGLWEAFDDQRADFSGMDGIKHWLYISAVLHKAFVEVNEAGTEAAAATAVVMKLRGIPSPPVVFCVDRPFLFLIRENTTGTILFLGRMMNPTAEE